MEQINKYKKDDIVYSVYVNKFLIIIINKLRIESYFFNHLPIYNTFIYSCLGLDTEVNRTYEIDLTKEEIECDKENNYFNFKCSSLKRERNPGKVSSSSTVESELYLENELEKIIQQKLNKRIEQNRLYENE